MSKSLNNFYTIKELIQQTSGLAIRLTILSTHYKKPLDFTKQKLHENQKIVKRIKESINEYSHFKINQDNVPTNIMQSLSNDLNTPLALNQLWELRKKLIASPNQEIYNQFISTLKLLGLYLENNSIEDNPQITKLAEQRVEAKNNKNWQLADKIREQIKLLGYEVVDTKDGYKIK